MSPPPASFEHDSRGAGPTLVLASASPRRADLLRALGLDFEIVPARVDESILPGEAPTAAVERLSREKAAEVAAAAARHPSLVVAGDTMVLLGDEVLGKPADPAEAREMLRILSGREHQVLTGLALAAGGGLWSGVSETRVAFRTLADTEISAYVETGEPMDKAGAYGIQERGAALVSGIAGDYFTVVGFPIPLFLDLLRRAGWRYTFGGLTRADL